jgi:hypothetical protein
LKAHYNQLSILSGEQNLSEIIVLQCLLLDVSNIAFILAPSSLIKQTLLINVFTLGL